MRRWDSKLKKMRTFANKFTDDGTEIREKQY